MSTNQYIMKIRKFIPSIFLSRFESLSVYPYFLSGTVLHHFCYNEVFVSANTNILGKFLNPIISFFLLSIFFSYYTCKIIFVFRKVIQCPED